MSNPKDECMSALDGFLTWATSMRGYSVFRCHTFKVESEAEKLLASSLTKCESLTGAEFDEIRTIVDEARLGRLITYGMRMATFAVRQDDPLGIWHGLMGLVLENSRADYRDIIIVASLLYDAAGRVNANPDELFDRAITHATVQRGQLLKSYLGGPGYNKFIASMGFEAAIVDGEFVYRSSTAFV